MSVKKISVFIGSLRKDSWNRKIAGEIIKLAPETLSFEIVEIGHLGHYNEDLDQGNPPQEWLELRSKIRNSDGFLFFTPEYNRSMSSAIKNAIDIGSRPYGQNSWAGKPGAVVTVSMSAIGGFGANHHLRQTMVFVDVAMMQQPEAYIGNAHTLFDDSGKLVDGTRKFLEDFVSAFESWVNRF